MNLLTTANLVIKPSIASAEDGHQCANAFPRLQGANMSLISKVLGCIGFVSALAFCDPAWTSLKTIKSCGLDYRTAPSTNNRARVYLTTNETNSVSYYYLFDANVAQDLEKAKGILSTLLTAQASGTGIQISTDKQTYDGTPRDLIYAIQVGAD